MASLSIDYALPDTNAAQHGFSRVGRSAQRAAFIAERTRDDLLERLDLLAISPALVLDLCCGPGFGLARLAKLYPDATILGIDLNRAMCIRAHSAARSKRSIQVACAAAERLPIRDESVGLIFANLALPWCRPEAVFAETARILSPGGVLLIATFGPATLAEVRNAWAMVDRDIHVHAAFDMQQIAGMATRAGLTDIVLDVDTLHLSYSNVASLVSDLRTLGGTNFAAGRRKSMTGKHRWLAFDNALRATAEHGRIGITAELLFGHARAPTGRRPFSAETTVPVEAIKGRRHT